MFSSFFVYLIYVPIHKTCLGLNLHNTIREIVFLYFLSLSLWYSPPWSSNQNTYPFCKPLNYINKYMYTWHRHTQKKDLPHSSIPNVSNKLNIHFSFKKRKIKKIWISCPFCQCDDIIQIPPKGNPSMGIQNIAVVKEA